MSANFLVVKVDPEGSGLDYSGHLGKVLVNAKRCCENCTVIFGTIGSWTDFGPFIQGELSPLNDEARAVEAEINTFVADRHPAFTSPAP